MEEQQDTDTIQLNLAKFQRNAGRDYNEYFIPSNIKLVLATMPQRATAAWDGAPHSRLSARSTAAHRRLRCCTGPNKVLAIQGMAATPPANKRAMDA